MFPENCGILLSLVNDLSNVVGDGTFTLVLFGSSLVKGCSKDSDIDLLLLVYDNVLNIRGESLFKGVSDIVKRYEAKGYRLSLNLLALSDFMKKLMQGDSFAIKIVNTGVALAGDNLFSSIRRFVEKSPITQDKEYLAKTVVSLVDEAAAVLEASKRDLFVVCGHLKTAVGYLLTLMTGIEDPEKAIDKADNRVREIYLTLKDYCKRALKGELPPVALDEVLRRTRESVQAAEKFI